MASPALQNMVDVRDTLLERPGTRRDAAEGPYGHAHGANLGVVHVHGAFASTHIGIEHGAHQVGPSLFGVLHHVGVFSNLRGAYGYLARALGVEGHAGAQHGKVH
ncbi:MAG: hypothetical protein BWX80_03883 [Candidatus Hydrogenedentes bacterium ADurb.Bin101]|nr:MAG: hypothetical protein BWX80_03883 [Candidatus Hydrogenedentes bacterium ADurb.Bin101]